MFKAENFDADAWVNTFKRSGAQYVVPVAEHHDGFQMYDSELSSFNAVDMGPGAVLQEGIIFPSGIGIGTLVSVGNPHMVLFSQAVEDVPLYLWGPRIEADRRFPGGVNVEFVQILSPQKLRMRVWERGCGITMACGTGACATAFTAVKEGFCPPDRPIEVVLDGGSLFITVDKGGTILMEGPAVTVFEGEVSV